MTVYGDFNVKCNKQCDSSTVGKCQTAWPAVLSAKYRSISCTNFLILPSKYSSVLLWRDIIRNMSYFSQPLNSLLWDYPGFWTVRRLEGILVHLLVSGLRSCHNLQLVWCFNLSRGIDMSAEGCESLCLILISWASRVPVFLYEINCIFTTFSPGIYIRLLKILEYVYVTFYINNNYICVNIVGYVYSMVLVHRWTY